MKMNRFVLVVFLLMPFLSLAQVKDTIIDNKPFIIHTVEFRETLYGISRNYNAELNDIVVNNPFVINGLQMGTQLLIPVKKSFVKNFKNKIKDKFDFKKDETFQDKVLEVEPKTIEEDSIITTDLDSPLFVSKDSTLEISLLLPFYLDLNDSLNVESQTAIYSKSKIGLDYYFGALLAIDSLQKLGVNINFNVYDIPNDSVFEELLLAKTFNLSDIIIGPLYISQFNLLAEYYANDTTKRLVSPLSFKNIDKKYTNTYQIVSSSEVQIVKMVDYLNKNYDSSDLLIIGQESEVKNIDFATNEIKLRRIQKNILPKPKVLMFESGQMPDKAAIKPFLGSDNIIIIPSNNRSFISRVLPILSSIQDTAFVVYGLSTWDRFENIDIENLNYLNTVLPDLENENDKDLIYDLINSYFINYHSYPSKYSIEGYKQLLFFCSQEFQYLYDFSKIKNQNNFVNSRLSLIQYQNYQKIILQ
jgi:hypothetical protein